MAGANLFLAPGTFRNIQRSIIQGVGVQELDIRDPSLRERILAYYGGEPVKLWALKKNLRSRWVSVGESDFMLFYNAGRFIYAGIVAFKYPFVEKSEQVEAASYLAESVWGRDVDGETWSYLFFLRDVREVDLPLSKFNELTGYKMSTVGGFMRVRKERASRVIEYLQQIYSKPPSEKPLRTPEQLQHDEIVDIIYAIGELIGYKPQRRWRHEGYEFDVVWHKPPRVGPKYVFEVHLKGNLEAALLRLKHAYDLWESRIFLVSTEDQLKDAQSKFLGELHEIKDVITLLKIEDVKEFYQFKGKFEWLERKFGLKPS